MEDRSLGIVSRPATLVVVSQDSPVEPPRANSPAALEQMLASASPVWEIAQSEPLTLLALSQSVDGGPLEAIARMDAYLLASGGGTVLGLEDLGGDGGARWSVAIRVPQRENAIILFAEEPQQFADPSHPSAALSDVQSTLGLSTPLESPFVEDFIRLVRLLHAASGELVALVDPALDSVRLRADVQTLFLDAEPLADERALFRTQIVSRGEGAPRWLFTEGMPRVGKPDFEMLEVDPFEERAALTLLEVTAGLFVSRQLPPPETPFDLGVGVTIALVPPREAFAGLAADVAGSARDREGEHAHFSPRVSAVLSAPHKRGAYRQVWTRPIEAIAALQRGEAALALPDGVVRSTAFRARASWSDVAKLRADAMRVEPILAQVSIASGTATEHAWVEVRSADARGGSGILMHALREGSLLKGASVEFKLSQVTDWSA